jgi:2-methylisocitrate lyase-like PEP mutase family enzyme
MSQQRELRALLHNHCCLVPAHTLVLPFRLLMPNALANVPPPPAVVILQDAITRANLYADAGADAVYVEAPISKQELSLIGQKVKGLRVMGMLEGGMTPLLTPAEAKALGFHILTYPLSGIYAATR